jgi:hypothetical protein
MVLEYSAYGYVLEMGNNRFEANPVRDLSLNGANTGFTLWTEIRAFHVCID